MWYSFNMGPVHWLALNTETDFSGAGEEHRGDSKIFPAGGFAPPGAYLKWLEADLQQAQAERVERPWVIATGHRPFPEIATTMGALFDKYGVDVYFSGHKHYYLRGTNGSRTDIVIGSGGCDEMAYQYDPITGVITAKPHREPGADGDGAGVTDVSSNKVSAGIRS